MWITDALAAPVDTGAVDVDGATVRYRAWGPVGTPGLVLVHGGAANARWWDHIGPLLTRTAIHGDPHRVVALDLTGHGDSDRREQYGLETWAREVLEVAGPAGIAGRPTVVGHSMGGMIAWVAARLFGEHLAGIAMIDSPIVERTPEEEAARAKRAFGPIKVYPTRDDALAHFRFVPPQDAAVPEVRDHIARESMREVPGGWSWKFDPALMTRSGNEHLGADDPRCRTAYLRAEHGIVTDDQMADMTARFGESAIVAEIPDAGHHVMIDRPLALVAAVRVVLAAWAATRENDSPSD
ncbi:alpha/beta hydrolase [Rhodococcus rhodnii]|uniref:Hydrolase n=2 Tax=Rhodococcus rhodnii TaxID=38312 RepID=R7WLY6_9NOCA|nr:alpha/beta hydrolase [Rhodococcus rhodnii]EOM76312.1 hydrolase [Rhodococcus rhodnii LMG 5362]TXG89987.1 alpha/beta hydrolase [Rhodococcus rhodnii]